MYMKHELDKANYISNSKKQHNKEISYFSKKLNKLLRSKWIVYEIFLIINWKLLFFKRNGGNIQLIKGRVDYWETVFTTIKNKLNIDPYLIKDISTISLISWTKSTEYWYKFIFLVNISELFLYSLDYSSFDLFSFEQLNQNLKTIINNSNPPNSYKCICCWAEIDTFYSWWANNSAIINYDIIWAWERENKNCKFCPSNDRERMISLYFKEFILKEKFSALNLLHIAPEIMLSKIIESDKRINYIRWDKFEDWYNYPNTIKLDLTYLPFKSNQFDFIICNHVIEHIEEDLLAIKEIYRVLNSSWRAVLQVPISEKLTKTFEDSSIKTAEEKELYFWQKNHVRLYSWDYVWLLESVGFKVEIINLLDIYWIEFILKHWLNPREKIILCKKH